MCVCKNVTIIEVLRLRLQIHNVFVVILRTYAYVNYDDQLNGCFADLSINIFAK